MLRSRWFTARKAEGDEAAGGDDPAGTIPLARSADLDPLTRYLAGAAGGYRDVLDLVLKRLDRTVLGLPPFPRARRLRALVAEKRRAVDAKALELAFDPARRLPLKAVPAQFGIGLLAGGRLVRDDALAPRATALITAFQKRRLRELIDLAARPDEAGWRGAVLRDLADFLLATEFFIADRAAGAGAALLDSDDQHGWLSEDLRRFVLEKLVVALVKVGDYAAARARWAALAAAPPAKGLDPRLLFADLFWQHDPAAALDMLDAVDRMPQSFVMLHAMLTLAERGVEAAEAIDVRRPGFGPDACFAAYNVARARGGVIAGQRHLQAAWAAHGLAFPRFTRDAAIDVTAIASDLVAADPVEEGPLVTVIVTAFNAAGTIPAALASLQNQTYRNLEIIVVDDLGSDATAEIVRAAQAHDPRIRLFENRANVGTYLSRNRALTQARGAFVTFQDSDDWSHPQRVARHVALMTARPGVAVSKSHWVRMRPDGSIPLRRWSRAFGHFNPSSLFIRAEALPALGYFDAVRADADFEYARRISLLFEREGVETIAEPLAIGFLGEASLTGSGPAAINAEGYSALRGRYKAAWLDSYADRLRAGAMPLPALPAAYSYAVPPEIAVDLAAPWFAEGASAVADAQTGWEGVPPFWFAISLISAQASRDWQRTVTVFQNCLRAILAQTDPDFRIVVAGHEIPDIPEMADPRVAFIVSDRPPAAKPSEFRADKMWKRRLILHRIRIAGGGYVMPVDADDLVSNRLVAYVRERGERPGFIFQRGYVLDWSARRIAPVPGAWSVPFERVCGSSAVFLLTPEQIPLIHQTDVDDVVQALLGPHANWRLTAEEMGRPLEEIDWPAAVYVVNTAVNLSFARQRAGGRAELMLGNVARAAVPVTPAIVAEFALDERFPQG